MSLQAAVLSCPYFIKESGAARSELATPDKGHGPDSSAVFQAGPDEPPTPLGADAGGQ